MKRLLKIGAIALVILLSFRSLTVLSLASGTGTEEDPYIITTAEELQNINNHLSAYYVLGNNIDLLNADFTPIGNGTLGTFTGSFDGKGYTISNLNVYADKYAGLFGCNEGTVKNVTLSGVSVYGTRYVGGVVGDNTASGVVADCEVLSGRIYSEDAVYEITAGGIIGHNSGTVNGVMKNSATVDASSNSNCYAGGIIGKNDAVLTITAHNTGVITGNCFETPEYGYYFYSYTGGIIGFSTANVTFVESSNEGTIISCNPVTYAGGINYAGGLISYCKGFVNITDSYNSADVKGRSKLSDDSSYYGGEAGGLAGYIAGTSVINNSFNSGEITSYYGSAGLVAYVSGDATVNRCYNSGGVSNSNYGNTAGLIGCAYGLTTVTQCFNTGYINATGVAAAFVSETAYVTFNDCYNTGNLYGSGGTAVFVGEVYSESCEVNVVNCYNAGYVSSGYYCGYIYSKSDKAIYPVAINSYNLKGSFASIYHRGYDGVSYIDSEEMSDSENLKGFDFENIWEIDPLVNNGYPVLKNNKSVLTLNYNQSMIKVGSSLNLIAYKNGEQADVNWSVTNGVATVSSAGNVYFGSTGTITITATDADGNKAVFNALVYQPVSYINVEDISININSSGSVYFISDSSLDGVVSLESSDTSVFEISPNGTITPVSVGTAYVTVKLISGAIGTSKVEITAITTGLWLYPESLSLFAGDTYQMDLSITPNPTTNVITWCSSDEAVATVDQNGVVTALSAGAATISVETDNGYYDTCVLTVKEKVTELSFVQPSVKIYTNDKAVLKLNVLPDNYTESISYSCSDYSIYVSSNGVVQSYSTTGSFTVTATTESGLKAFCTVTVENWPEVLTISDESVTLQKYYLSIPEAQATTVDNYIETVDGFEYVAQASFSNTSTAYYGTGSTVTVYDNTEKEVITYSVVVPGDVNGDSVCDVIDCTLVSRTANLVSELEGAYLTAADYDYDETVTVIDYQQVVNEALTA